MDGISDICDFDIDVLSNHDDASASDNSSNPNFVVSNCLVKYQIDDLDRTFNVNGSTNKLASTEDQELHQEFDETPNIILGRTPVTDFRAAMVLGREFMAVPEFVPRTDNSVIHNVNSVATDGLGSENIVGNALNPSTTHHSSYSSHSSDSSQGQNKEFRLCYRFTGGRPPTSSATILRASQARLNLSTKYQGGITDADIQIALLPEEENCALFLQNIHSGTTRFEIFSTIDTGKVYRASLLPPELGKHETCAAFLTFTTRDSAEEYLEKVMRGIQIRGLNLEARWNQKKNRPTEVEARKSRVVCFSGPVYIISFAFIEELLSSKVHYNLVTSRSWTKLAPHGQVRVIEMAFESAATQGELALICFRKQFQGDRRFKTWYGKDPCEP